jgi:O-antigen ligase
LTTGINKLQNGAFAFLGFTAIASVLTAVNTGLYYLALLPFALIVAYIALTDFKLLYYLLLFTIPLSMEYSFTPSLGTDLPDEPLMVGLMFVTILYLLKNPKALPTGFFGHAIMFLLVIHLFWIFVTMLTTVRPLVSIKAFLSKTWYVSAFSIMSVIVLKTEQDLKKAFWVIFVPLTMLIIQVLVRFALIGFEFDEVNTPMWPFFRNHVNYAAILSVFLPFIWFARGWYAPDSGLRRLLNFSVLLYVVAIYLSFTRTTYIAVLAIFPVYQIVRYKLMKPAVALAGVAVVALCFYLFTNNNYLKFAPDFTETVYHDDFGDHLSSTFEGKDVSSMERVYRWVAIFRMFRDRPIFGFGPGNFYPYYKGYTVTSFETYVSDNEEHSTAHNYFLLLLAEQGLVGVIIFMLFTAVIFISGENIYHRLRSESDKRMAMIFLLMLAMIYVNLMLSDLLESDKVGPFFFISIAMLAALDVRNKQLLKTESK